MLNQAVPSPSTTRGALAKHRLGVPGTACTQGERQAGREKQSTGCSLKEDLSTEAQKD